MQKNCVPISEATRVLARLVSAGRSTAFIAKQTRLTERTVRTRIAALADLLPGDLPARRRITEWWLSVEAK